MRGLAHIRPGILSNARYLVLERLLATHPLKEAHMLTLLTAIIEMDINEFTDTYDDAPNIYIDRLMSKI